MWYRKLKEAEKRKVLDTQLLCCGYPENRRKDKYKRKKTKNYPKQD